MSIRRIVVVGASAAGTSAARTLRRQGFDGSLVLLSQEPHEPYRRPPLSKWHLTHEGSHDDIAIPMPTQLDLDLRTSTRALDLDVRSRVVHTDRYGAIPFDGLVIATGATARKLPMLGELPGVHTLRTLDDCADLREAFHASPKVAVVGGGFIGTEVAATARSLGLEVTIIEGLPGLYSTSLGDSVGKIVTELHREHGTRVQFGVPVRRWLGGDRVGGVQLADDSIVDADLVIVGVGVTPATAWLEGSGITLDRGVVCDATCAAHGVENIVTAGDVARWFNPRYGRTMRIEHWDNAVSQGAAAAKRLLGDRTPFAPVPFFWSDQYDMKIQLAGVSGPETDFKVIEGDLDERKFVAEYTRHGATVGVLAVNSPSRFGALRRSLLTSTAYEMEASAE